MVYANAFNVFILAMEIAVVFFAAVAVLLTVTLIVLRARNARVQRKQQRLDAEWQSIFRSVFTTPIAVLPAIAKDDLYGVTLVFNAVRELRAADRQDSRFAIALDAMARQAKLDVFAQQLLDRGDDAEKIVALTTLGQLGDQSALARASRLMTSPGTELSRAAAHCLLRLNRASIDEVLGFVRKRGDWVRPRVEQMLREIGTTVLDPAMQRAMGFATDRDKLRLLEVVGCCSNDVTRSLCLQLLQKDNDPEVIAAALKALGPVAHADDGDAIRTLMQHEKPFVRLAAIRALKYIATSSDHASLESLLADRDWWVRQRAAQVLVAINHGNSLAVTVAEANPDPYARAAVAQAIAEYRMGVDRDSIAERRAHDGTAGGRKA